MSKRRTNRKEGHFRYGVNLKQRNYGKLKSRTKRERSTRGDEAWEFDGFRTRDLRILRKVVITREGDFDDYEIRYTVKLPSYVKTSGQAKDYLEGCLYMGCRCSHDCCGHFFSRVWTHTFRRTKRNEYTIRVAYQRNC